MKLSNFIFLMSAALIWGLSFSAQKAGMEHVGPITFNTVRTLVGSAFLIPCIFLMRMFRNQEEKREINRHPRRLLLQGGLACGAVLTCASFLQQIGMKTTESGKAGFITAFYILLVPIIGIFIHKACSWIVWLATVIAVTALYFLSVTESFTIELGDILLLGCAFCFALHILVIDYYSPRTDNVALSCLQFFVVFLLGFIPMCIIEGLPSLHALKACAFPLFFSGVMSCGVAYTFQIFGQKNANPTIASIIMSLESVFAVLGGMVILGERPTAREWLGCSLMMVAIILAQIPVKNKKRNL